MTSQARGHRRHAFRTACIVTSRLDGRVVGERSEDVSYSGLRVSTTTDAVRLGEQVDVSLQIPGSQLWLSARGRIVRAMPGRREGDAGPSVGVRLDQMDGMSRALLTSIVSTRPLVEATRGGRRDYAEQIARICRET